MPGQMHPEGSLGVIAKRMILVTVESQFIYCHPSVIIKN
jgi:hypothetical protein